MTLNAGDGLVLAAEIDQPDYFASFTRWYIAYKSYHERYWRTEQKNAILTCYRDALLTEDDDSQITLLLNTLTDYTGDQKTIGVENINYIIKCIHCIAQTPKWGHKSKLDLAQAARGSLANIMTKLGFEVAGGIITHLNYILLNHPLKYEDFSSYIEILKLMGAEINDTLITGSYEETNPRTGNPAHQERVEQLTKQIKILYNEWAPAPIVKVPTPVRPNSNTTPALLAKTPPIDLHSSYDTKSAFKPVTAHPKTPPTAFKP